MPSFVPALGQPSFFSTQEGNIMQKKVTIRLDKHQYKEITQAAKKQHKAASTFIKELCLIGWEVIAAYEESNGQDESNHNKQTILNEQRIRVLIQLAYETKELAALTTKQSYPDNIECIREEARRFAFEFMERSKNI